MVNRIRSRWTLVAISLVILLVALSCSEEVTPTATPDTAAAVQQAIQQALADRPSGAQGPSSEDIAALVQSAVAASAPEGASAEQMQEMVEAAVAAAAGESGVSEADLQAVVAMAVEAAVSEAAAQATPGAMPTDAPMPTDTMTGPYGTLRVAVEDLGPPVFVLSQAGYPTYRFLNLSTDEMMFATSSDGKVVGRLAESWNLEKTADGALYTFNLRRGVAFHDNFGDWGEFSADDLLFSLEDATKEGTQHSGAAGVRRVWFCDECEITKVDDYTVELRRPEARFDFTWDIRHPFAAGVAVHSKKHFETVGEDEALGQSVATGAWQMEEFRTGDFFRMKGVQDHWRNTPDWEEFEWHLIREESTRIANFLTGLIDTGKFVAESVQIIKGEDLPSTKYLTFPGVTWQFVPLLGQQYNTDHPSHVGENPTVPLGENVGNEYVCNDAPWVSCDRDTSSAEWQKALNVRLAMTLALDRQKMVNALAFGEGDPWHVSYWHGHEGRLKQFGLDKLVREFDLPRAKQLMADAGYADGFEIDMALTARAFESATATCTMWQEINVECSIRPTEYSAYRPTQVRRTAVGARSNNLPAQIEPLRLYPLFYSSMNANNYGLEHPELQKLIDEALNLFDDEARWAKQAEIAHWFFDNVVDMSLYAEADVWPLGPEIDVWETMPPVNGWINNWDTVPHRQ